ncbi:MAG: amidohydrolase, partial [Candidatus Eremiobacteraeota bacterium]|nr:amidohydrolase [Candidatus Eremiobacteraeota bacterium]
MCNACVPSWLSDVFGKAAPTRRDFLASAAAFTAAASAAGIARAAGGVEIIFHNALFHTQHFGKPRARALALSGGRIVAVGSEADVFALKTNATRTIDLDGRHVFPGFIDRHQHPISAAAQLAFFDDAGPGVYKNKPDLIAGLQPQAASKKPGEWLYVGSFDNILQGGDLTVSDLDQVSTSVPVFVFYNNSHTASVNTAAFNAAGITKDSPNRPGGGAFGRTAGGDLNGVVYETNMIPFFATLKITPQAIAKGFQTHLARCAAVGLTTIHEAGSGLTGRTTDILGGYQQLASSTASPVRLSSSPMIDFLDDGNAYARRYGTPGPRAIQVPGSLLSFYAVKIVGDGSNQTETAGQTIPYLNSDKKGTVNYTRDQFVEKCQKAKSLGWPISIHSNGDATLDVVLDAIEAVYGAHSPLGINRIEHCTITRPEQIERMAKLGVQPSFLINHVYYYGAAYRDALLGPERAARMDPGAQAVSLKLPFTFHSDAPVTKPGPLQMIGVGVTRRSITDGSIVGKDQAISVDDSLRTMTI